MKSIRLFLKPILLIVLIIAAYLAGYYHGLSTKHFNYRALAIVNRNPMDNSPAGESYQWFDFNDPADVARFYAEEGRLKAKGIEYYAAEGIVESSISTKPDPQRVSSHR